MGTGVLAGCGEGDRRIKRPGSEVTHATSSRAEVKNEYSHNITPCTRFHRVDRDFTYLIFCHMTARSEL
jgi:hypothetical protein